MNLRKVVPPEEMGKVREVKDWAKLAYYVTK